MNQLENIFIRNKGYARMEELKRSGIQTRKISKAVKDGLLIKVSPGLYKLTDYPWDEHGSFADVCNANKKAVICLLSAAAYYDLTTFNPSEVYAAVPHNTSNFKLDYPPIKVYYWTDKFYNTGIEKMDTNSGIVRIYNREKTIIDLFRYINKTGEDVAIEALKNYMRERKKDISRLAQYSMICGITEKIAPYIKGML
ncbi:MAG: type IV toxin-antitoxin system AbiEi family antitoxin domain-containing protein [Clostridiales bacterium]